MISGPGPLGPGAHLGLGPTWARAHLGLGPTWARAQSNKAYQISNLGVTLDLLYQTIFPKALAKGLLCSLYRWSSELSLNPATDPGSTHPSGNPSGKSYVQGSGKRSKVENA